MSFLTILKFKTLTLSMLSWSRLKLDAYSNGCKICLGDNCITKKAYGHLQMNAVKQFWEWFLWEEKYQYVLKVLFYSVDFQFTVLFTFIFKGAVERTKLYQFDYCSVPRIPWHKRITSSLKQSRLWHVILASLSPPCVRLTSVRSAISMDAANLYGKKIFDDECWKPIRKTFF